MGQLERSNHLSYLNPFSCVQTNVNIELLVLNSNAWNHLTVWKQIIFGSFKKGYLQTIHLKIICINRIWD